MDCTKHKEEYEGRMKTDAADWSKMQGALVRTFIHPFKPKMLTENILVNIYSGEVGRSDINNNSSLEIEVKEMIRFQ